MFRDYDNDLAALQQAIINNISSLAGTRSGLLSQLGGNLVTVDVDKECGYPLTQEITPQDYRLMYERHPLAARMVDVFPKECWTVTPSVYETEDPEHITPFEEAWLGMAKKLQGENWFKDEQGSPIWETLRRIDILSGIGHYGVLLFGIDDGMDLSLPAKYRTGGDGVAPRNLLYLRAFDESLALVTQWETDRTNPRYGKPTRYQITLSDPSSSSSASGIGEPTATVDVHWTRILHVADNCGSSELIGAPRQRAIWNQLIDTKKVMGSGAQGYWYGAFPGLSIESIPQLGGDVTLPDPEGMKQQINDYLIRLKRGLLLTGFQAKSLAPQAVDPTPWLDTYITIICIVANIPKRIFMGTERGDLASGQDDDTWNDRLMSRHNLYLTPRLIVPFVNRLIALGVLPVPADGFSIDWPDLNTLDEKTKGEVAVRKTEAMMRYVQGEVAQIMAPKHFYTLIMGFNETEAESIVKEAEEEYIPEEIRVPEFEKDQTDRESDGRFQQDPEPTGAGEEE